MPQQACEPPTVGAMVDELSRCCHPCFRVGAVETARSKLGRSPLASESAAAAPVDVTN